MGLRLSLGLRPRLGLRLRPRLGFRPRLARALLALLAVGASSGCARTLYNFSEVSEGRIYRGAQPSPLFLRWLAREHGIRALVNLRGRTPGYESAFAARHGLRLFSLDLSADRPPTPEQVERFLRIVRDPENYPLLVHCRNGVDRTGYMVATYRILEEGWDTQRAIGEMNRHLQFSWVLAPPQAFVRSLERDSGTESAPQGPR